MVEAGEIQEVTEKRKSAEAQEKGRIRLRAGTVGMRVAMNLR